MKQNAIGNQKGSGHTACGPDRHPVVKSRAFMRAQAAFKRLKQKGTKGGLYETPKDPPSLLEILAVERKIRLGKPRTKSDSPAMMLILRRFSHYARIARAMARSKHFGTLLATECLLDETTLNVRCLDQLRVETLRDYAARRTVFPMLVGLRKTSQKRINQRMNEIGLGRNIAPGYQVNARWKMDEFADAAQEILVAVFGNSLPHLNADEWKKLWPEIRPLVVDYLREPSRLEYLKQFVTLPDHRSCASRWKERVIENIHDRMRAKLGAKGNR